jgi:hypothetical protein
MSRQVYAFHEMHNAIRLFQKGEMIGKVVVKTGE